MEGMPDDRRSNFEASTEIDKKRYSKEKKEHFQLVREEAKKAKRLQRRRGLVTLPLQRQSWSLREVAVKRSISYLDMYYSHLSPIPTVKTLLLATVSLGYSSLTKTFVQFLQQAYCRSLLPLSYSLVHSHRVPV